MAVQTFWPARFDSLSVDRRVVLRVGLLASAAFACLPASAISAAPAFDDSELGGAVLAWMTLVGGEAHLRLLALGPGAQMVAQISEEKFAFASLAEAARRADEASRRVAAARWAVPAAQCATKCGRIVDTTTGRSLPVAIWTDFA